MTRCSSGVAASVVVASLPHESTIVNEWKGEARRDERLDTLRQAIRDILAERDAAPLPTELSEAIDHESNPDILRRWMLLAARNSVADLWNAVSATKSAAP